MWPKLHHRLKNYVPLMIGLGGIIIVIDVLVFLLHRFGGLDKGTALYFSILLFVGASCLVLHRQLTVRLAQHENNSYEDSYCETNARE